MARILYDGGAEMVGSIGGLTFQKNHAGTIVKKRSATLKTLSAKKSTVQSDFIGIQSLWYSLTLSQKNDWNDFADLHLKENMWGQTKKLTGFNWFCMLNYNRYNVGAEFTTIPPSYNLPGILPTYYLDTATEDLHLIYEGGEIPADTGILLYTSSKTKITSGPARKILKYTLNFTIPPIIDFKLTEYWESTHSIKYSDMVSFSKFNIQAFLVPYHKISFIDAAGIFLIDELIIDSI